MANFENFKQKTTETAEYIAAKSIELARLAAEKTKLVARISKLNADILTEKEAARKAYMELGKLYYEAHKNDAEPEMAANCARITEANAAIADHRAEISMCKSEFCNKEKKEDETVDEAECCCDADEAEKNDECDCCNKDE